MYDTSEPGVKMKKRNSVFLCETYVSVVPVCLKNEPSYIYEHNQKTSA